MTDKEAIAYFTKQNETIISIAKDENVYDYENQQIEPVHMKQTFEANEAAIKALERVHTMTEEEFEKYLKGEDLVVVKRKFLKQALESPNITWIVGENGEQLAFKDMPIDKAKRILAIVNGETEGMRDATEQERKSVTLQINKMSKHVSDFSDFWEEIEDDE